MGIKKIATERKCSVCEKILVKRKTESHVIFADRHECTIKCAAIARARRNAHCPSVSISMNEAALALYELMKGWVYLPPEVEGEYDD